MTKTPTQHVATISLLGGLQVRQGTQVWTKFRRNKEASLLAYLAFHRETAHARGDLIARFWPDQPDRHKQLNSLNVSLTSLRKRVQPFSASIEELLVTEDNRVSLNPRVVTDVSEFDLLLKPTSQAQPEIVIARLTDAVELYRGELLPGFNEEWDAWVEPARTMLGEQYATALVRLADALERSGDRDGALERLRALIRHDPLAETGYVQTIRLLGFDGRAAEASTVYKRMQRVFRTQLSDTPSRQAQELIRTLRQRPETLLRPRTTSVPEPPAVPEPFRPTVPASTTSLVGRDSETVLVTDRLFGTPSRLVTLVAMGGMGKTRLALHIARVAQQTLRGRVCFIEVTPATTRERFVQTLCSAVGLTDDGSNDTLSRLQTRLNEADALLVIDSAEHCTGEIMDDVLIPLLNHCQDMRLLATSRRELLLPGESVFHVLPLVLPDTEGAGISPLRSVPAVALFIERAQAKAPDFTLTKSNARDVTALVRQVEGIPLGLELAASWMGVHTPASLAEQFAGRFHLLDNPRSSVAKRHQSLPAVVRGSVGLLEPTARVLFALLSVFHGGWTRDAAEWLINWLRARPGAATALAEIERVEHHLDALHAHGLLVRSTETYGAAEEARFRYLDAVREAALAEVETTIGTPSALLRDAHVAYFLHVAAESREALANAATPTEQRRSWLSRMDAEHDNLTVALA